VEECLLPGLVLVVYIHEMERGDNAYLFLCPILEFISVGDSTIVVISEILCIRCLAAAVTSDRSLATAPCLMMLSCMDRPFLSKASCRI
jgi:hypothetical protein